MANYTLTHDEKVGGWTSFHSYAPDFTVNMNNEYFTFHEGNMYIHNVEYGERNTFYGEPNLSEVTMLVNDNPSEVKNFKTLMLESSSSNWHAEIETDLDAGHINPESFADKEGMRYAYIRRNETDEVMPDLLSVQGIGDVSSVSGEDIVFTVSVPGNINVGDTLYHVSGGENIKTGIIESVSGSTITLEETLVDPSPNDFCFAAKNKIAESYGLKGYFAKLRLICSSEVQEELFAVNSEVTKSFP